jgi:hypothetical protein
MSTKNIVKLCLMTTEHGDGYRQGTCVADRAKLIAVLGKPTGKGDGDKVTMEWHINTPRGIVALRDYWWNAKDEWSIGTASHKACLWAINYLRSLGFVAYFGHRKRLA